MAISCRFSGYEKNHSFFRFPYLVEQRKQVCQQPARFKLGRKGHTLSGSRQPKASGVGCEEAKKENDSYRLIGLVALKWVWVKNETPGTAGDHRFLSMLPLTRVPFRVPVFDPQPNVDLQRSS